MITVNDVYRKIKELSAQEWKPRPVIQVNYISQELQQSREAILPCLQELTALRLIVFDDASKQSVKLTLLGNNVNR